MFFFDPLYMLLILIGLPLVFLPQMWVKNTYEKYSKVHTQTGLTGAEVARQLLQNNGISNVSVEVSQGFLSDHYDPMHKVVRLSESNYHDRSVAAVAVAAHEVGHAIQHARGYFPVVVRSAMVPVVNLGSQLGPILIIFSLMLMGLGMLSPNLAMPLAWMGALGFGLAVAFHFVTLPVEIDASSRALKVLKSYHLLSSTEMPMAHKVLRAAAFTYIATALYALMQLAYFVFHILGARRD